MNVTEDQLAILSMFRPRTYAICLSPEEANPLCEMGLLEWVPPVWGSAPNYSITDEGRALAQGATDQ